MNGLDTVLRSPAINHCLIHFSWATRRRTETIPFADCFHCLCVYACVCVCVCVCVCMEIKHVFMNISRKKFDDGKGGIYLMRLCNRTFKHLYNIFHCIYTSAHIRNISHKLKIPAVTSHNIHKNANKQTNLC